MESREEIESMRVIDLRDFIKRHGRAIRHVMRESGTPGPLRKAELLKIALEIYDDSVAGKPSPPKPGVFNPFQSGLPSTPERKNSPSEVTTGAVSSALPVMAPEESKPPKTPTSRARRKSSVWIDPSLLAQMQAPAAAPRAVPIVPRPPDVQQTKSISPPSPRSTPKRVQRPVQKMPSRVEVPEPPQAPKRDMTPRRVARKRFTQDPVEIEKPKVEDPPPRREVVTRREERWEAEIEPEIVPVPSRPSPKMRAKAAGKRNSKAGTPAPFLFNLESEYQSDEDPDYDIRGEDADEEDGQFEDDVEEISDDDAVEQTRSQYTKLVYDGRSSSKVRKQEKFVVREDVPVDSDHALESDPGSTVETEDEAIGAQFRDMTSREVRGWLRDHDVPYRPMSRHDELVSLARAHVLHLQATENDNDSPVQPTARRADIIELREEDAIVPNSAKHSAKRRRRVISAPYPGDEVEEVIQSSASTPVAVVRKNMQSTQPIARAEPQRRRHAITSMMVLLLSLFLLNWAWIATTALVNRARMVYCDTNIESVDDSKPCRPCPENGKCQDGLLECEHGYLEWKGRCETDDSYATFLKLLEVEVDKILSNQAGLAECREAPFAYMTVSDLLNVLREKKYRGYHGLMETDDEVFLRQAVEGAIASLSIYDKVVVSENGTIVASTSPIISMRCQIRRKMWEYKRGILGFAVMVSLLIYVRVRKFMAKMHEDKIARAHHGAVELLRDQLNGFRSGQEDVAFVADVILREELVGTASSRNVNFWKEVEERLKRNPRVMRKHQVVHGIPSYTYEYIGRRRSSSAMNPNSLLDTLSRRSSFGSRTSLDSLDMGADQEPVGSTGSNSRVAEWLSSLLNQTDK